MPPAGRRTRRRRAAFRGHFFTTTVARLGPHLRGLEASLAHLLPELFDGTVADRLVTYLDPHAGPGVAARWLPATPSLAAPWWASTLATS